jgi:hypothetical protein
MSKNALNLARSVSIPTYRSFDSNYGNDGCDGFSPNFPLICKQNRTANYLFYVTSIPRATAFVKW